MEKIYQVEFINYTSMNQAIWNRKLNKYIHVGNEPFLIKESEIDKYKEYGDGFRIIKFVGNMKTSGGD